jgi:alpha/beta superfamily hydrolase
MINAALRAVAYPLIATISVTSFIACGEPARSTPSPEAIATAESVARQITFEAQYSATPEKDDEDKTPVALDARVFGSGATGVILAHMRPADQTSWFPFATKLAETGEFTAMTFDFRGYGESEGDKQFDRIDADLHAAIDYMRDTLGISKIFVVGASMGGTAAVVVAENADLAGVVSISSPGQFPPFDAVDASQRVREPKLFITSEDDVPAARSQEDFWEAAPEPKQQHVYDGDAHGTALFDGPHATELEQLIFSFLRAGT